MAANVPLSIQTVVGDGPYSDNSTIVMGSKRFNPPGNQTLHNVYWALIVDRTNLNVVQDFTFSDNQSIPAQVSSYNNNPQYLLILTTDRLKSNNLPAGMLYAWLQQLGAGIQLIRIEQIFATLGCGTWGNMGYTLVAAFDSSAGIEFGHYTGSIVADTLQLIPVTTSPNNVLYTPVAM
jgi:hypothetical protein